jgi:ferredoxin-type protein NapG
VSGGILHHIRQLLVRAEQSLSGTYAQNRLRPPGAMEEKSFMSLCIRCNRCLEVCPYGSIKRAGLGPAIGTPYVLPEAKACYLCMACCRLCPTGALDPKLVEPSKVNMGKARIDTSICYSHLFLEYDVLPDQTGRKIGALCNTCYNVCPLPDTAIMLEKNLFPKVLDGCVGCGICVERCPTRPARAVNVIPSGMGRADEAGFYFRKAHQHQQATEAKTAKTPAGVLRGEDLLREKYSIKGTKDLPTFEFPYPSPKSIDGWE